jgi:hypothetical protein
MNVKAVHFHGPKSFSQLYGYMVEAAFKKHGFINLRLLQDWPEIVGKQLAQICRPMKINFNPGQSQAGVLHLQITNPAFSLAVTSQQTRIIDKISTYFGYKAVSKVRISIKTQTKANRPSNSSLKNDTPTVARGQASMNALLPTNLSNFKDPELKEVLASIYRTL